MTGINITLVRFALDKNSDFLRISQNGVAYNITGRGLHSSTIQLNLSSSVHRVTQLNS